MNHDLIVVSTTAENRQQLDEIARALLAENLAACVQIGGPITSHYRWQGELQQSDEWTCLVKTTASLYSRVETVIQELHDYDVPQIVAVPILHGYQPYLEWVREQTGQN